MNPKKYRKLEGVVGRESYLAALARKSLVQQGFTELDDTIVDKANEVHEAQMDAMVGYMQKDQDTRIIETAQKAGIYVCVPDEAR